MVFTGSEEGESMAVGPERLKPLHNFMLPCLKWGTQRHLRCTKLPSDSSSADAGDRPSPTPTEFHFPPPTNADSRTRLTRPRFLGDDGIDAVREKLMLDLKTEADRMKDAILGKEVAHHNDILLDKDAPEEDSPPSLTGLKTWNLRTRRAPVPDRGVRIDDTRGGGGGARSSLSPSPLRTVTGGVVKSPKSRRSPEKEERRVKFSLPLTKKEVEEDFMKMAGHRPPRRPKRRPKHAQKHLDTLFPGLWLSEVSADCYKVPDDAETSKR